MSIHTIHQTPRYGDFSPLKQLGLGALTRMIQEAAISHSKAVGLDIDRLMQLDRTWVLHKLGIFWEGPSPEPGQAMEIRTWCCSLKRFRSRREYLVLTENQPAFRATSLWLCMDPHTRRLASLPDELAAQYAPRQETVTREDLSTWKPSCPENDPLSWTTSIRLADMDGNGHLNNAVYLDLAEDALYRAKNSESKIDSCRILFGREVPAGTGTLDLDVWPDANHALVRLGGSEKNAMVEIRHG